MAVKRPITSSKDLNKTDDFDKVKAFLGFASDDLDATTETDHPEIGRARRLRDQIADHVKCLALYRDDADAFLAEIIKDKFRHGERVHPMTIEDLTDQPTIRRDGQPGSSQLDQVLMRLAGAIQPLRKAAGDTLHEMKLRAGVPCDCARCRRQPQTPLVTQVENEEVEAAVTVDQPF